MHEVLWHHNKTHVFFSYQGSHTSLLYILWSNDMMNPIKYKVKDHLIYSDRMGCHILFLKSTVGSDKVTV
jgi:hypothetical protein